MLSRIVNSSSFKKRISILVLITLVISLFSTGTYALASQPDSSPDIGEYIQVVYNDSNGFTSNEANDILYSSSGYIWIGSYSGLTRYDSNTFISYADYTDHIMSGVNVRTLFEDSCGRVWIGSNDSGLYVWDRMNFHSVNTFNSGISNCIRDISEAADGSILVATTAGMAVITTQIHDNGTINFSDRAIDITQLCNEPIHSVETDSSGLSWAVKNNDVIAFTVNGEKGDTVEYRLAGSWSSKTEFDYTCITAVDDKTILVGTSGAYILRLTPQSNNIGYDVKMLSTGKCSTINKIYQDSVNRIWLCSDKGIGYFSGNSVIHAGSTKLSSSIENMTEDYEGNLWFASSRGGIMKFVRGKFASVTSSVGLEGTAFNAVLVDKGIIYAAADSGFYMINAANNKLIQNDLTNMLKGIRIRGLMLDSNGYIWITTYANYGVIRYKDGEFVSISTKDGLASDKTRVAYELTDGRIAVATNGGLSIIKGTEVARSYTEADGLANPEILCICQDNKGRIYCGSDGNGIYVIDDNGIEHFTAKNGIPSDVILNVFYDEDSDSVWISSGGYLSALCNQKVTTYYHYGNGTDSIFDVKVNPENGEWIILSKRHIALTTRNYLVGYHENAYLTTFDRDDGLMEISPNSRHFLTDDGILYIATSNGIYKIDTSNVHSNLTPPRAIINSVTIDNSEVILNPVDEIVLDSDVNTITIDFSVFSYVAKDSQIEYQLLGMDRYPIRDNGRLVHSRDYTNLRGGTYTFRLSVTNSDGVPCEEEVTLKINKKLSFIEHPLGIAFISLCALLLITAVVITLNRISTARIKERQEHYRNLTESALLTVAKTIDAKDSYTNGHSYRVAQYSREIAERLGWTGDQLENLYYTALLHDIGKIGIPDNILTKNGRLTDQEFRTIKRHPVIGYKILKDFASLPDVATGARYHHERYDGTGYAVGLKGDEIPLIARIIAVADAYDAMSTARIYRKPLSKEKIISEFCDGSGTQFDPKIAQIILDMIEDGDIYFEEE